MIDSGKFVTRSVVMATVLFAMAASAREPVVVVVLPIAGPDGAATADEVRKGINLVPGHAAQARATTEAAMASASALGIECPLEQTECMLQLGGLAGGAIVMGGSQSGKTLTLQALGIARKEQRSSSSSELPPDPTGRARAIKRLAVRLLAPERDVGSLQIIVHQRGASVVVDGVDRGRSPLAQPIELTTGKHEVYVALIGYESEVVEVNVEFDDVAQVAVTLRGGSSEAAPIGETPADEVDEPGVEQWLEPTDAALSGNTVLSVLVLDFDSDGGLQAAAASAATRMSKALSRHPRLKVLARADVGGELSSCDLADPGCLGQMATDAGADLLAFGSLTHSGGLMVLRLNVYEARTHQLDRRSVGASSSEELERDLPKAVHEIMTPLVGAPESKDAFTSLGFLGGGAVVVVAGAVTLGLGAFAAATLTDPGASADEEAKRSAGVNAALGAGAAGVVAAAGAVVMLLSLNADEP
jgi:hypothetical protein